MFYLLFFLIFLVANTFNAMQITVENNSLTTVALVVKKETIDELDIEYIYPHTTKPVKVKDINTTIKFINQNYQHIIIRKDSNNKLILSSQ